MDVRQVVNALELLEFFAEHGRAASLAEISRHFEWPRSSTFNLVGTLVNRGYLYEPRAREGYYPTPTLLCLAQKIERSAPIPPELEDLLAALRRRTHETAVIAAISGMNVVFIATAESQLPVRYAAPVGKIVPLHATATGRVLLSQLPETQRMSILRRAQFERYTPHTLMSVDAVEREIALSLQRGYFEGAGEFTPDLGGIAIPLKYETRHMALLVGGPVARITAVKEEIITIMREEMARYASDVSRALP